MFDTMSDILLSTINAKWIHPSLALRLLKANLGALEPRCEILEFALRQPLAEKTAPILAARPRVLGISVSIWNHTATVELLKALDPVWADEGVPGGAAPRPIIVLGGPEASFLQPDAELFRYADYVIRGEGEIAFRELCTRILEPAPTAILPKFIDAPPVDPALIDPGYRLYTAEDLTRKLSYVEASRGCPFGCEFCLSSAAQWGRLNRRVREFPLDKFLGEMEILIARGARSFKFLDRTFNLDIERAGRILEFFLERLEPPMYVHFEMVPSRFPRELREALTRFPPGSLRLELGIQTLNRETAARIGRPVDPERELEVLDFLRRETQAIVHADLIAGLPGEDMASFARGFDRLWQVRPTEIQLGILKCLPGTAMNRHIEPFGMRFNPNPPYEVLETAVMPPEDLDRIKNFARFWELIVNRGVFPHELSALFPEGVPIFAPFMALSDRLLEQFGRNWGIDRRDLQSALK
ncbi:B12-binding domain-containing radical SAM protein [Treponema primitia]|uniref:B12-binding domain-containing radical SAM protein n=1 Tax=Treponema primitia TaxID=88058 RepID=UPI0002555574|nr:B12-binding domain-containing radical SAM protein [Treponema primitia]